MKSPLAESERDRLIAAILPDVAFDGWSRHALRLAAGRIGVPVGEAMALFPRGAPDMVAAVSRWADRARLCRRADGGPAGNHADGAGQRVAAHRPRHAIAFRIAAAVARGGAARHGR